MKGFESAFSFDLMVFPEKISPHMGHIQGFKREETLLKSTFIGCLKILCFIQN